MIDYSSTKEEAFLNHQKKLDFHPAIKCKMLSKGVIV